MKFLKWMLLGSATALVGISNANAHDSFSIGLSIGGPAYYAPPPVQYYAPPVVVYRAPPPVVYQASPPVMYAPPAGYYRPYEPRVYYHYYDGPSHFHHRGGVGRGWH